LRFRGAVKGGKEDRIALAGAELKVGGVVWLGC
jgi:hypothetical protein